MTDNLGLIFAFSSILKPQTGTVEVSVQTWRLMFFIHLNYILVKDDHSWFATWKVFILFNTMVTDIKFYFILGFLPFDSWFMQKICDFILIILN